MTDVCVRITFTFGTTYRSSSFQNKMGLLTNPKTPVKFHSVMRKFGNKVCVLSYLAGVVSFVALAHRPLNAGTYFSENALLPGITITSIDRYPS